MLPSTNTTIHLCLQLSVTNQPIHTTMHPIIYAFIQPNMYPLIHIINIYPLHVTLSHPPIYAFIHPNWHPPVYLCICSSIHLDIYPCTIPLSSQQKRLIAFRLELTEWLIYTNTANCYVASIELFVSLLLLFY